MRAAIVIIGVVLARLAHAEPSAGVIVTGEPTMQAPVKTQIQTWLSEHHFQLVESPLGNHGATFVDCFVIEDLACARGIFDHQAKAESVVLLRVDLVAGENRELALTGHWFIHGRAIAEKRACKDCDDAALRATLTNLLDSLVDSSGIDLPAPVGSQITAIPVKAARSRLGPAVAIGAGAATLAGGLTYLYFGHQGGRDDPYRYPDATTTGTVLATVGVSGLIGGVLWWRHWRPANESRRIPALLVAAGAAALAGGGVALYYANKRGVDEPFVYPDAVKIGAPFTIAGGSAIVAGTMLMFGGRL